MRACSHAYGSRANRQPHLSLFGLQGGDGAAGMHVAFFRFRDVDVDNEGRLGWRQPFNMRNPDGPLELCTCAVCGAPIMLDDRMHRIRVIVPNLMGFDGAFLAATPCFFDLATGEARPGTAVRSMRAASGFRVADPA